LDLVFGELEYAGTIHIFFDKAILAVIITKEIGIKNNSGNSFKD